MSFAENNRYQVLTKEGFKDFIGIMENGVRPCVTLHFHDGEVTATPDHTFFQNGLPVLAGGLSVGQSIDAWKDDKLTSKEIVEISHCSKKVYDLVEVDNIAHDYITNGQIITKNCDEAAFLNQNIAREFWTAIQPTLSTGGSCIITSTPLSDEDLFAELWFGAIDTVDEDGNERPGGVGRNGFKAFKAIWSDHPERDEAWADAFRKTMSEGEFKREFECVGPYTEVYIRSPYGIEKTVRMGDLYERSNVLGLTGFQVMTDKGYRDFTGIAYMGTTNVLRIEWDSGYLDCTPTHRLYLSDGTEIEAQNVMIGDDLFGEDIPVMVTAITPMADTPVFDLLEVEDGHRYFTSGVLSHNCEFIAEDTTLISGVTLANIKYQDAIKKTGNIFWYEELIPNRYYVLALDPALGSGGGDYAAIQIFRLPDMVQIGEWRSQRADPVEQVGVVLKILNIINDTLKAHPDQVGEPNIAWTFENNAIGQAVLQVIKNTEAEFPGWMINEPRRKGMVNRGKGLNTNKSTKLQACLLMKRLMERDRMTVRSRELLKELKSFVGNDSGSFSAKPGNRDDLVMATILCVRLAEIIAKGEDEIHDAIIDGADVEGEEGGIAPMPILI